MKTQCNAGTIEFQVSGSRRIVADFGGGRVSSDGGALLLAEVERARGIIAALSGCFIDHRDPARIEHTVAELLAQRIYGLVLGYEDLNDHDALRRDPLLAALSGKADPTGGQRRRERDRQCALAGKSTLNRLELTPEDADERSRYQKIVYDAAAIARLFVEIFLSAHAAPPERIILDLDATDDPIHGEQEGRFFHGYYGGYCYLPLYIFCGDHLLCALLRPSNIDAPSGALEEVQRIVGQIRGKWSATQIILRADSGFAREELMAWCEQEKGKGNPVDYIFGLAKNQRLEREIEKQLEHARRKHLRTGKAARCFRDFQYRTLKTWSAKRRVIGKAEHLDKGSNPRFIVTSLEQGIGRDLYERLYCARGEMENRIKEQQLDMFSDRTSSATMRANQLRLWLSSVGYVLLSELRRLGLSATPMERAQAGTIRGRLLKVGALVRLSVRRIWVRLSSAWPQEALFARIMENIRRIHPLRI